MAGGLVAAAWVLLAAGQAVVSLGPPPAGATGSGALGLAIASYDGDSVSSTPSESAQAGSDVTYQVTVTNATAVAQTDVSVPVSLPANFTLDAPTVAASTGTSSVGTGTISWSIPTLAGGASATLTYTETTDAPASLESDGVSASATSDQSPGAITAADAVEVVPAADLAIGVTDGVDSIAPGATETYTVTVTDSGPSAAPNATVTETFDGVFAALADGSSDGGASFTDLGGGQFEWTGIDLASGASATFTLVGTVPSPLPAGGAFVDVAAVSPEPGEIDTNSVSSATDSDVVTGPAAPGTLGVAIASYDGDGVTSSPSEAALAGTDVTYLVTVTNSAATAQTDVSVPVTLPPAFSLHATPTASAGSATTGGGTITWTIPSLPAAASATLTYTETTDSPGAMEADGTSASATSDQSTTPTGATAAVEVIPAADLAVSVTDGVDTVTPGSSDTYTITLTDNGPSPVTDVAVTDTLSGGFTPLFAVSSVGGTSFTDLGAEQFEWAGINLASGASATFTLMGNVATSLTAGSAFVDLAAVVMPPGQIDTDMPANAVDSDLVILAPQSISFTPPATGIVGQSVTLSATGGGSGNPVVFSVDPSSGAGVCSVSGANGTTLDYDAAGSCVIDADQAGDASDAAAPTVTATIVVDQVPAFTQDAPPTSVTAGQPYAYTFAAGGFPAPTYSLAAGAPSWLSIDAVSGAVSGTPPAGTASFTYSVVAANGVGSASAGPFSVTVQQVTGSRDADIWAALACPTSVPVDTVATCTLTIRNAGPSVARSVTAGLALPFSFWRVSSTGGGWWWFGHLGLWFVGPLDPGSSASFSVSFRSPWPAQGTVMAAGLSANPDPSDTNDVATASVTIDG